MVKPEIFSSIIRNTELMDIKLISVESILGTEPEKGKKYSVNLKAKFPFEKNGLGLVVLSNYNVYFSDNESKDTGIFKFKCMFALHYNVRNLSEYQDDAIKYFADNNAKFNSWSYFRELLSNITMRMEIGSLVAPLLKPRPPERLARPSKK